MKHMQRDGGQRLEASIFFLLFVPRIFPVSRLNQCLCESSLKCLNADDSYRWPFFFYILSATYYAQVVLALLLVVNINF